MLDHSDKARSGLLEWSDASYDPWSGVNRSTTENAFQVPMKMLNIARLVKANLKANGITQLLAKLFGNTVRDATCSKTTRLRMPNLPCYTAAR